jgi:predicted nucleotidyltransferase
MKVIFLMLAVFLTTGAAAQTKRIAHRSHSGSNQTFNLKGAGNWGEIYMPREILENRKPVKTDTVKVIKVKPFNRRDSIPPKANPVYTRKTVKKNNNGRK